MTTSSSAPQPHGRIYRTLAALSAHTVESYMCVWGSRPGPRPRTAEEIALHG